MSSHAHKLHDRATEQLSGGLQAARESASEVGRHVRDAIEDAVEHGKTTSSHLSRRLAGTAHHLADRGRDGLHAAQACISRHTLLSTLTAFGAGLLLARLLFRR